MNIKRFLSAFMAGSFFAIIFSCNMLFANAEIKAPSNEVIFSNYVGDENFQKYLESLPQKTGNYKSSQRPVMIEGAMNIEIDNFVRSLKNPVIYRILNYVYVAGTYKNYPVIIARTEQGIANAATVTALGIENFNPVAVINQGTAGGYIPDLHLGDIVICEKAVNTAAYKTEYSPQGAGLNLTAQEMRGTFAYDKQTKTFQPHKEYFADEKLLSIAKNIADSNKKFNVTVGTIGSADAWHNGIDHINFLHEKYGIICEEMETVAAAQICKTVDVPFIGIRTISNNITNGDEYSERTAVSSQNFVLLVVDKYISSVLKK